MEVDQQERPPVPATECAGGVSSELYAETTCGSTFAEYEPDGSTIWKTRFLVNLPRTAAFPGDETKTKQEFDSEGDLITTKAVRTTVVIAHRPRTPLSTVGEQVWRGALLLSDFVLSSPDIFTSDTTVLELGSGTGLTAIIAATVVHRVICTDVDRGDILTLCKRNVTFNDHLMRPDGGGVTIKELDWMQPAFPSWVEKENAVDVIIAADGKALYITYTSYFIYDNELSDYFLSMLKALIKRLRPKEGCYIALEKRYVFTLADMESVAPMYEHFLQRLRENPEWNFNRLDVKDLPQHLQYDRTNELVLWKLELSQK
ncbi:unnamed protein product [Cyprideis torosa]|uniref:Uncharacterized protein n=1 Tax=Cyprideis torosa TaxID=163714 RepID=A0A7R8ZSM5_9CRUS|nr:unnamed protein product [Cyprideis torosa]CAG0896435.1 unnamed protein product [Cyprideis torosa]